MQQSRVQFLIQEGPTCHRATKAGAITTEAELQSLGSATSEATEMRSPCTINHVQLESSPCSPQLEKSPHGNEDPAQPKN